MKLPHLFLIPFSFLLLAFAGCASYDILSSAVFSDEDGAMISVSYGHATSDHESTFVAPNGKELTFKTRLVVEVTLPNGDDFTAWQLDDYSAFQATKVFAPGSTYRSRNREWIFQTNGIRSIVYHLEKDPTGAERYVTVFRGEFCTTEKGDYTPNPKERKMKKNANGVWQ